MRARLRFSQLLLTFLSWAMIAGAAQSAPGLLDRTFGGGFGYVRYGDTTAAVPDTGSTVAIQPDGKILTGGATGLEPGIVVLRYNVGGTLDDTFATHGEFRWKRDNEISGAQRIVPLQDGRIFVFGYVSSAALLWMARLMPDGALDATFGSGGVAIAKSTGYSTDARRVLLDDRGGLVVLWEAQNAGDNKIRISRFLASDGSVDVGYAFGAGEVILDTSMFGAVTNLPFGAAFDPEGKLVVFASSYNATYNTTLIYRFQRSGYPDSFFGNQGMISLQQKDYAFYGHKWTVLADRGIGYLLVEWMPDGVRLQRFDLNGHVVTSYGAGGIARFDFDGGAMEPGNALVRPDGSVVVAGTRHRSGFNEVFMIGVTTTGALDTRLGSTLPQRAYRGEDFGSPSGMTGADLALAGSDLVIAGSAATRNNADDVHTLKVTGNGVPNTAFGGTGRVTWNGGAIVPEQADAIWPQADGKLLTLTRTAGIASWRRFTSSGQIDATFGVDGKRAIGNEWTGPELRIFTAADGKILLARQISGTAFTNVTTVARFRVDGTIDTTFGAAGRLTIVDDAHDRPVQPGIVQLPSGRLLIATYGDKGLRLRRTSVDGALDQTFGNGAGVVYPPVPGRPQLGYAMSVDAGGRIVLSAATIVITQLPLPQTTISNDVVVRLLADGSLDPSFGIRGGVVPIQVENARDPQIVKIIPIANGKLLVAGNISRFDSRQFFFLRLNSDGTIDNDYGDHSDAADGPGPFIFSDVFQTELRDAAIDAAGRLVIAGNYVTAPGRSTAFVIRFLANGTTDPIFGGTNRHLFLFERPEATSGANAIALLGNSIVAGGFNGEYGLLFKLEADGSALSMSQPVLEFYNTRLDHYFITADSQEAAAIDAGAAGPGWQRTGRGFRAWIAKDGIPADAQPVCRFYGAPGLGPNSHFYTADARECDVVRKDPGWRYEGVAFYSIVPSTGFAGVGCPTGMQRVLRAYNNRFAQNDSNHRYTTDPDVIIQMQQQGWTDEGVVLCSPTN